MSRPKRIPGYQYVGVQQYFITACTHDRTEHFCDAWAAAMTIETFLEAAHRESMDIVYCVMPDHVHLLAEGEHDGAALEPFMNRAKQRSGFQFKQRHRQKLWQEGYYEHVLRAEEKTTEVIFYIISNPLRKHLVENVLDYPYWGSSRLSREDLLYSIGIR